MSCGTLSENTQVAYMNCLMTAKKTLGSQNRKCRPYLNLVHSIYIYIEIQYVQTPLTSPEQTN